MTVFMHGLNFLDSHWQFSHVNLNMTNCETAFLSLELKYLTNANIENCTFGNWTFKQVQNVIIKNCSNTVHTNSKTSDCAFPLWKIINVCVGCTILIVAAIILNRKWKMIKYHYYVRFTNDDDSQDLSEMEYDAFVSYRFLIFKILLQGTHLKQYEIIIPQYFTCRKSSLCFSAVPKKNS